MLEAKNLLDDIRKRLASLQSYIRPGGALHLTDINIHAEDFVAGLLNAVYGWSLVNANRAKSNYPCIDLVDEHRKIGVQVTSEEGSAKITNTLECLKKQNLSEIIGQLKMFMLVPKQTRYTINVQCPGVVFDWKEDVLDFDGVLKDIQALTDLKQLRSIRDYVADALPGLFPGESGKRALYVAVGTAIAAGAIVPIWLAASAVEPPMARLPLGPGYASLARVSEAYAGMGTEFRSWEELKSKEDREAMLAFTDRFVQCPIQFVMRNPPSKTTGIRFDFDIRRGANSRQLILRDVVVEVVRFHSVAPTFWLGAAKPKKPLVVVEMCNRRLPLPWTFRAKWIADSTEGPLEEFEGHQVLIERTDWETFLLKLEAKDRGIYEFNIDVVLQQDDEPQQAVRVTEKPIAVGFFLHFLRKT